MFLGLSSFSSSLLAALNAFCTSSPNELVILITLNSVGLATHLSILIIFAISLISFIPRYFAYGKEQS
ncbi:hypothetical protein FD48_GL000665 [Lactiplantibacillus paraplantarum DSM 10667]|nr:hypothetical protein FD48_GL000665 [Lactiplantibacillus paraplantarum DSM 10667]